ncbi:MAG: DUF6691 family protein [Pseudomonadota bacterium]
MRIFATLLIGALFATGLVISGMTQPAKVIGFLDLFGTWDPSLALVMGSALVVAHFGFKAVLKRPSPVLGANFELPSAKDIDKRLVIGASFFGLGWGMSGFCPGPALVALGSSRGDVMMFVAAMFAGFFIKDLIDSAIQARTPKTA